MQQALHGICPFSFNHNVADRSRGQIERFSPLIHAQSQRRWASSCIHKEMFLATLCKRFHQKVDRIGRASQKMALTGEGHSFAGSQNALLAEVEQALGSPLDSLPQAPVPKSSIVVISGPSGVGKDAVINVCQCIAEGNDAVLRVDVQGAATVRSVLGSGAIYIFLVAENELALVTRLIARKTETTDKLLLRIATARDEVKRMSEYDYVVVNAEGQLEKAVSLICSIIDAEKARVDQRVVLL